MQGLTKEDSSLVQQNYENQEKSIVRNYVDILHLPTQKVSDIVRFRMKQKVQTQLGFIMFYSIPQRIPSLYLFCRQILIKGDVKYKTFDF